MRFHRQLLNDGVLFVVALSAERSRFGRYASVL